MTHLSKDIGDITNARTSLLASHPVIKLEKGNIEIMIYSSPAE